MIFNTVVTILLMFYSNKINGLQMSFTNVLNENDDSILFNCSCELGPSELIHKIIITKDDFAYYEYNINEMNSKYIYFKSFLLKLIKNMFYWGVFLTKINGIERIRQCSEPGLFKIQKLNSNGKYNCSIYLKNHDKPNSSYFIISQMNDQLYYNSKQCSLFSL